MVLGIRGIEASSVYQDIFSKGRLAGRIQGTRDILFMLGQKRFGQPSEQVRLTIAAMDDLDQLRALLGKILDVSNWDELLAPCRSQV